MVAAILTFQNISNVCKTYICRRNIVLFLFIFLFYFFFNNCEHGRRHLEHLGGYLMFVRQKYIVEIFCF